MDKLSTKDTTGVPRYFLSIIPIYLDLPKRTTSLLRTKDCPKVSLIQRFQCVYVSRNYQCILLGLLCTWNDSIEYTCICMCIIQSIIILTFYACNHVYSTMRPHLSAPQISSSLTFYSSFYWNK
jgi:hypothetical protein